jgi:hypothetical protein
VERSHLRRRTFKCAYDSAATRRPQRRGATAYSNLAFDYMLFWVPRSPAASSNYAQLVIHLNGGGSVVMSAPSTPAGKVLMGGGLAGPAGPSP